jgi:hypothetical protein
MTKPWKTVDTSLFSAPAQEIIVPSIVADLYSYLYGNKSYHQNVFVGYYTERTIQQPGEFASLSMCDTVYEEWSGGLWDVGTRCNDRTFAALVSCRFQ